MSESLAVREAHGFRRTECGCAFCQAPCRHIPGSLDPSDLPRLCPTGQDVFVWAEQHLRAVTDKPVPTLVPARHPDGPCHWYFDDRCAVHEHAPYSCAFFDMHMSAAEVERRSAATIRARREDAAADGLYFRVWRHLCERNLTAPSGDRTALAEELQTIRRHAERQHRRLTASPVSSEFVTGTETGHPGNGILGEGSALSGRPSEGERATE
jgi:hypothetical protein